jgi:predicted 3-demethylubiquinone-9 3-methyltransferase (glyoxalase superfamily)
MPLSPQQKITPFLWFDTQAEEAAKFYTSIFKKSKITSVARYGDAGAKASGRPKGSVMTVGFRIEAQQFVALNGGPVFKLNESVSFVVKCKTQKEIDYYWGKLSAGGDPACQQCGWLKDKFGVSWQVVPADIEKWTRNPATAEKLMAAILTMKKIDLAAVKKAFAAK